MFVLITIKGCTYKISSSEVRLAARQAIPEKIKDFYVEVEGENFPPKQLIRLVTKTADSFNSSNARSALTKLGFIVKAKRSG